MNQRKIIVILMGLLLLLLPACSIPINLRNLPQDKPSPTTAATQPAPAVTDAPPQPSSTIPPTAVAAPTGTAQPEAVIVPTSTTRPTTVLVITAAPPQNINPFVTTQRMAEVRVGPGTNYALSHTLGPGTSAPVQGRSADGQWWAVPGPGDEPGPLGWLHAGDVILFGDTGSIPVLQPPSGGRADVPVHVDPGSPPTNACIAVPLGSDLEPVFVRLGPGEQFNVSHRLGGWAEVVKSEIGWHMVLLGPGETGWVNGSQVQLSGLCS